LLAELIALKIIVILQVTADFFFVGQASNPNNRILASSLSFVMFAFELQAEAAILRGPHEDLESYLEAVEVLKGIVRFFNSNKNFKSSDSVLNHVNNLLAKSTMKIEEEFKQLMSTYR